MVTKGKGDQQQRGVLLKDLVLSRIAMSGPHSAGTATAVVCVLGWRATVAREVAIGT